jgi:hypothetical protein
LFSVEFYRLAKRHMAENGLFVQWLHLYELDTQRVISVMKALDENFSDYAMYVTQLGGDILIIATPHGVLPEIPFMLPDMPQLKIDMERVDLITPQDIAIHKLGGRKLFAPWLAKSNAPANSDYYPYLDQYASRDRFIRANSNQLFYLTLDPSPIVEMLGAPMPWAETSVTASPHWRSLHPVFGATLVRDLLQGRPLTRPAIMPEARWSKAVARATQVIEECRAPAEGDNVNALLNLALEATPYLRPQENAQLMQSISGYVCVTRLTGQERAWLNLLTALGQRNGHGMAESAKALMEAELDNTSEKKLHLLAMGMLGNLSINRPAAALSIWQTIAPQVFANVTPPVIFQIMAAWSEAGAKQGGMTSAVVPLKPVTTE